MVESTKPVDATLLQSVDEVTGKPKRAPFEAVLLVGLVISNVNYEHVRGPVYEGPPAGLAEHNKKLKELHYHIGWKNVLPAHDDAEKYTTFLTDTVGILKENIITLKDATNAQVLNALKTIKEYFKAAHKDPLKKFILWVNYGGHGVMKNKNFIVLNEKENKKRFFDLEYRLNSFAENFTNSCCVLSLDCCREEITAE